ncbi:MAG: DUF624 domain-containing protein [Clostridium butyricum]|nr:DUF624 domain-containing protein [Clostridium butyricum]
MAKYSDFQDKPINKTLNYIHWFFISNIFFSLCNILFTLSIYLFDLKFDNILIFFLALIPTGPALSALCYFMHKLISDKYVDTTRDFFKGYTQNFKESLKLWIVFLVISFVIIFDLKLCFINGKFLLLFPPMILIMILASILISYSIPILSRYEIKLFNAIKLSFYLALKNPITTTINLFIIGLSLYIFLYSKGLLVFFVPSIGCYILMKNMNSTFLFIENKYLK